MKIMERIFKIFFLALSITTLSGHKAEGCACCSDLTDVRKVHTYPMTEDYYDMDWQLSRVALEGEINVGNRPLNQDGERGDWLKYDLEGDFEGRKLKLTILENKKILGIFVLEMEDHYQKRSTDINFYLPKTMKIGQKPSNVIYFHEIVLQGKLNFEGDFIKKLGDMPIKKTELILYGNGNSCFMADKAEGWWLNFDIKSGERVIPASAKGEVLVKMDVPKDK